MKAFDQLKRLIALLVQHQGGATAVEYGIMISLIAAVVFAAVVVLGGATLDKFECLRDLLLNPRAGC